MMDNRRSQLFESQAVQIYGNIIKKDRTYQRLDEVLFTLAYILYESGEKAESLKIFWELIKNYPDSRFVPDAYLAMGEHYFDLKDPFKAMKAYEIAIRQEDRKVAILAQYKVGWCYANLGDWNSARNSFLRAKELSEQEASKTNPDRTVMQIRSESEKALNWISSK